MGNWIQVYILGIFSICELVCKGGGQDVAIVSDTGLGCPAYVYSSMYNWPGLSLTLGPTGGLVLM